MLTVNIGIRHNNNFAVTQFCNIKFVAYTRAECGYNRHKFIVSVNSVKSCLFYIEHFTPERQNSLEFTVTTALCRTARRVTLYDVNFGNLAVF